MKIQKNRVFNKKKKIHKFFVLRSNKFKTIVKSRIISQGQQVLRLDNEDDIFFNFSQKMIF